MPPSVNDIQCDLDTAHCKQLLDLSSSFVNLASVSGAPSCSKRRVDLSEVGGGKQQATPHLGKVLRILS